MSGRPGPAKCSISTLMNQVRVEGLKFTEDTNVKKKINDPSALTKEVFEEVFRLPFEMKNVIKYTPGEVRQFQNRLSEIRRSIRSGKFNGRLGEFFFNTSARAKKFPLANKLLNQMIDVNYSYKGRQSRHNTLYNRMLDGMKTHLRAEGLMSQSIDWSFKKAVKKAEEFDILIRKLELEATQGNKRAFTELAQMRAKEATFYKTGEGKLFSEVIDMIENKFTNAERQLLEDQYYGPRRKIMQEQLDKGMDFDIAWKIAKRSVKKPDVWENTLHKVTKSEPLRNVLETHLELMDNMYVVLDRGVGAYVEALKISLKGRGYSNEVLDSIASKIKDKIRPKKEGGGFYPHFRREMNMDFLNGLMPHFENISNSLSEFNRADTKSLEAAIGGINTYLTPRAKGRAKDIQGFDYSKNFVANIKRYVDEIDRFNYLAHTDLYTKRILEQSKELFKEGNLDGYGKDAVRLIQEMNLSMKGQTGFRNQALESTTRTLLGLEFVSKLGFNLRSAARNASQGLLNFVEFGPIAWAKSTKFYRQNDKIKRKVDKMLDEAGLLFSEATPELEEMMTTTKGKFTFKLAGEKIVLNEGSRFQNLERKVSKIAGSTIVSGLMRKVENMNRKTTFKIAFYKMYNELDMNRGYKDWVRENSNKKVKDDMASRARNYAIRMTTLLHYDYSALSKSKYLKHPVGRLLGQFQHYAWKFTEYNYGLMKDSMGDFAAGSTMREKFYGPNMAKSVRMGFAYFLAPAIASAFTGVNIGNLIEHDASKRMDQLGALFTGDDDEIRKAFYGRGVGTGLIGAPAVSDALAIGNIFEWWEMDDDDMSSLLTGYQDYARVTNSRKTYELIHILNTQLGRTVYQTIPMMSESYLGTSLQFELGLYPNKASKDLQKKVLGVSRKYLPKGLEEAFRELQREVERGKETSLGIEPRT